MFDHRTISVKEASPYLHEELVAICREALEGQRANTKQMGRLEAMADDHEEQVAKGEHQCAPMGCLIPVKLAEAGWEWKGNDVIGVKSKPVKGARYEVHADYDAHAKKFTMVGLVFGRLDAEPLVIKLSEALDAS